MARPARFRIGALLLKKLKRKPSARRRTLKKEPARKHRPTALSFLRKRDEKPRKKKEAPQPELSQAKAVAPVPTPLPQPSEEKGKVFISHILRPDTSLRQSFEGFLMNQRSPHTQRAYGKDLKRQNAVGNTLPGAASGGAGTIADGSGTGWNTLAARGTWRPEGLKGAHWLLWHQRPLHPRILRFVGRDMEWPDHDAGGVGNQMQVVVPQLHGGPQSD